MKSKQLTLDNTAKEMAKEGKMFAEEEILKVFKQICKWLSDKQK